jgi:hypothetical protein
MSCSPIIKGTQIVNKSCYTYDTLKIIKNFYNKKNPKDKIKTNDPIELWKTLKTRLVECQGEKERCWLNVVDDPKIRMKIKGDIFSPDAPPEWTKNPNEWLSNFDIANVLKQYEEAYPEFIFIEPSPIDFDKKPHDYGGECVSDDLCEFSLKSYMIRGKTKIGFVFNLDDHTSNGSHWVSMFLDLRDDFIFYFNSTGEKIPKEIEILKDRIVHQAKKEGIDLIFIQNHPTSHQRENTECGMYSLYFIISMLTLPGTTTKTSRKGVAETKNDHFSGKDDEKIKRLPKIQMFLSLSGITDAEMSKYRKIYFNFPTKSLRSFS